MSKTIVEKILSKKSGREVASGDITTAKVDFVMIPDAQGPWVIETFAKLKNQSVFDSSRAAFIIDHYVPCPNAKVAAHHDMIREFCRVHGIKLYESGEGICHRLMFEKGHIYPGGLFIGADSHSCSYGVVSGLGTGVGATDTAVALHYGELWFKVPFSIKVVLEGELKPFVTAKDIALYIIGYLKAQGALYKALEFTGPGLSSLDIEDRFTICNMSVECGAKFGIMPFDKVAETWCIERGIDVSEAVCSDTDAIYERELVIDLADIGCGIALPHNTDNYVLLKDIEGKKVDMVMIGTCSGGALKDLAEAAKVLRGQKPCGSVRFLVVPGSKKVYSEAVKEGYISTFLDYGAIILPPGCGPCCGSSPGVPGDKEVVLSTANRNFIGRMGNPASEIYLASTYACAAALITGKITHPEAFVNGRV